MSVLNFPERVVEVVSPPPAEPQQAQIINLMDALRKSVNATAGGETPDQEVAEESKPKRKMAGSKQHKQAAGKGNPRNAPAAT
jgi:hypothetical protein